jgi:hypothetical protein
MVGLCHVTANWSLVVTTLEEKITGNAQDLVILCERSSDFQVPGPGIHSDFPVQI